MSSLTPFFLDAAAGCEETARAAADYMMAAYADDAIEHLQLAAQVVAFGFAALDSLSRSVADKDLPEKTRIRLRGNATTMNRAAQQCRAALDRRRDGAGGDSAPSAADPIDPAIFEAAINKAQQIVAVARSCPAAAARPSPDGTHPGRPLTYWKKREATEREARLAKRQARMAAAIA